MSDPHSGYILAAYVVAAVVIGGTTLKVLFDYRSLKQALGRMVGTSPDRDDAA